MAKRIVPWLVGAGLGYWAVRSRQAPVASDLKGQVALVTGGSRGLGLLIARELARLGCKLAICARDEEELRRAQGELEQLGAEVIAVVCDVGVKDQVDAMVGDTLERFGRLDIVVNNASIIQVGPLDSLTLADFEAAMAVNYWGVVYTTLAALPAMRRQGAGRVVTIDSIGGRVAVPHLLPYDAAKFATRGFSEGLRAELAGTGISVTTVLPGLMRTGSPLNALFKGDQAKEFSWFTIGDSTALTAMDAHRAARRIVQALRRGEAELTLTWQAKTLGLAHDLFPGLTMGVLGLVNRLALPKAEEPTPVAKGKDVQGVPTPIRQRAEQLGAQTNQRGASSIW